MNWWEALVMGTVQGLTEFLPISSSGHLVLTEELLGIDNPGVVVEVALHVATLLAVIIVYRRKLAQLTLGVLRGDRRALAYTGAIIVATLPAVAVGLGLKDAVESAFDSLIVVGINLIVTGGVLWSTRSVTAPAPSDAIGFRKPLLIGLAQALAILPGISRSGSTIAAGMWLKLAPESAAEFSFIMAIPAIAGAAVLQLPELTHAGSALATAPLLLGAVTALVTGVAAIVLLVRLLKRGGFHRFAPYCWALGVVVLAWGMLR